MKIRDTIIAGSRGVSVIKPIKELVAHAYSKGFAINKILSGTAKVERYPADWDTHGKAAGYKRNEQMAKQADMLLAVWDGESRGTKHMIDIAVREGLIVFVNNLKTKRISRVRR